MNFFRSIASNIQIENKIYSKSLIWAIGLTVFYFFMTYPAIAGSWTNGIPNLLFIPISWIIPSAVNLLISYHLAFNIFQLSRFIYRFALLLAISLILGINIDMIRIISYGFHNHNTTLEIIRPVHRLPSGKDKIGVYVSMNLEHIRIKASPVDYFRPNINSGCLCIQFDKWPEDLRSSILDFFIILLAADKNTDIFLENEKRFFITRNLKEAHYFLDMRTQIQEKNLVLTVDLKDALGGYIRVKAFYPKFLLERLSEEDLTFFRVGLTKLKNDPYFWRRATVALMNDNFWHWLLEAASFGIVKTPISALDFTDKKRILENIK
jgi:hypothetical protein